MGTGKKQKCGRPINNRDYNFVISTSPDNNRLLLGNRYASDGISPNGPGVSITKKENRVGKYQKI